MCYFLACYFKVIYNELLLQEMFNQNIICLIFKVAECLVNPFGEDDDDFDMNTVIDRNLQVRGMDQV